MHWFREMNGVNLVKTKEKIIHWMIYLSDYESEDETTTVARTAATKNRTTTTTTIVFWFFRNLDSTLSKSCQFVSNIFLIQSKF